MNELNEIIKDYLKAKETDYAIMINGDWGCGKTYYIEHEFKDFISTQTCPFKPDHFGRIKKKLFNRCSSKQIEYNYTPAIISLYGVSSPDDFQYRIFLGLNTWANNKIAGAIASMGSKVAGVVGLQLDKNDTNNLTLISNNTVLVFDDLERICSDKISIKEVLGLINEYSERKHFKVIIVCNENVYDGCLNGINRDDEYSMYKEKTVRYTYRYEADIINVYSTIANTYDDDYKQYLVQNKSFILTMFELGGKKNLRTLKCFMDSMCKMFINIPSVKYSESILRTLAVSTMIYATEYKNGKRRKHLEELKATYELDLGDSVFGHQETEQENQSPSYLEEVANIYGSFYHNEMVRMQFVIDYLITGYLDVNALGDWAKERNNELINAEEKPEYQLYKELCSFATIDDNMVVDKLNLIIQYARDGKYKVIDLMNVYALLVKYHCFNIEGFSITDEVEKVFKDALDRYKKDWKFIFDLEYKIPIWDSREKGRDSFEKYDVIKQHLLRMNNQSRLADEEADYKTFLEKAESGDVEGIKQYREKYENRIRLGGIDWKRVCNVLDTGSNAIACEVAVCLQFLIPDLSFIHPDDLESLKEGLQKWLNDYSKKTDKRVRRLYILDLKRHIDAITR